MLEIIRSNQLEALVAMLAVQLEHSERAVPVDPFAPLRVVVGSKGMERWLRHQLAARLASGIAVNVEFPFPQQVLAEALARLDAGEAEPRPDPWSPGSLTWALLEVLPGLLDGTGGGPELRPLRDYLVPGAGDGGPVAGPITPRALALAGQLADVLDRVMVYRPELAHDWSRGSTRLPRGAGDLAWLPRLWQAVQVHLHGTPGGGAHTEERWRALIDRGAPASDPFDQPLRVFGLASLPPVFLHRLAWLARRCAVELYLVCPSDRYWADLHRAGRGRVRDLLDHDRDRLGEQLDGLLEGRLHPLLQSLGRVARDLQLVIEGLPDEVRGPGLEAFIETAPGLAGGEVGDPASALRVLQADVRHLRDPMGFTAADRAARPLLPGDDSLQVHACFGPTRQVEALREALLHLLEAHPDLEPRDVLVLAPDIEAWVPLIGAVFDQGRERPVQRDGRDLADPAKRWGPAGAPRIPWAISERSVRRTNPVAEVLLRVLSLAARRERLSSVAVLDLLSLEPFRRRFGIEHDDLETLGRWIETAGIRWGLDPADRASFGDQPPLAQNTWRFGLERLALGVAMADEPGRLWDPPQKSAAPDGLPGAARAPGVVPLDALEGGIVHLLGRFFDACTALFDEIVRLRGHRDLGAWVRVLGVDTDPPEDPGTLGRLTATPGKGGWLAVRVRDELAALRQAALLGGSSRALGPEAVLALLADRFEVASGAPKVHTGAVTFAALAPYRSVPYRAIALLGMDEGAFPRAANRRRFDPTQRAPRAGDRDPRDEDRYLLLEALLAARDHLLVFFTGKDPRSKEERAPAVPIGELLEVADATFSTPDEVRPRLRLLRDHPLQAFSPRLFDTDGGRARPWSYDEGLASCAEAILSRSARAPERFFTPEQDPEATAPAAPEGAVPPRQVTLAELEWFFRNPARTLLTRGLNLYLPADEEPLPHREPVEPTSLERWGWCRRLLDERLAAVEAAWTDPSADRSRAADPLTRLRAEGCLPLGSAGDEWAAAPAALVRALLERAAAWFGDAQAPTAPRILPIDLRLDLPCGPVRLVGNTDPIWRGDQLAIGIGDIRGKGKYRVGAWLKHLCWVALGTDAEPRTVLLSGRLKANGTPEVQAGCLALEVAEGDDARARATALLGELAAIYLRGLLEPLPLFPAASFAYAERSVSRGARVITPALLGRSRAEIEPPTAKVLARAAAEAREAFEGDGYGRVIPEIDDAYVARLWAGQDPIGPGIADDSPLQRDFAALALAVWQDCLLAWTEEGSKSTAQPRETPAGGAA